MLENIGKNIGYKATRGPLFTSTKKLELYSAQKEVLTHSGYVVGADMEMGFLMEGLEDAVVMRAFSDQCEYIQYWSSVIMFCSVTSIFFMTSLSFSELIA